MSEASPRAADTGHGVSFEEALRVWIRVGIHSFGGPAAQIAVMHRIVVDEKRWISEHRFLHALNYCMLLPGPEAQQLATYLGWLLHGPRGGLVAGGLFILPGFLSILVLSWIYVLTDGVPVVEGALAGLKAAVLAVVVEAVIRIGKRVLVNGIMIAIAVASFLALFVGDLPFPLVILLAGGLGVAGERWAPERFLVIQAKQPGPGDSVPALDALLDRAALQAPSLRRTAAIAAGGLLLWWGPVAALALAVGPENVFTQLGAFFGGAAMVTFGGAYAVLAYVAQQAVDAYGWMEPHEMLDGLGMAETTPGPLVQVVQFVGFLAAYRNPGALPPLAAATLGSVLVTWVTFVPCFLYIFAGAPYIEWLRGNRRLTAALSAITAAVVGVICNLGLWFALHVVFADVSTLTGPLGTRLLVPDPATIDGLAAAIAVVAAVAMLRFHVGMTTTLAVAAAVGALRTVLTG